MEWALGGQLGAGMGLEGRPQAVRLGQSRLQGCVIVKNVGVDPQCDGRVSVAQPRGNHMNWHPREKQDRSGDVAQVMQPSCDSGIDGDSPDAGSLCAAINFGMSCETVSGHNGRPRALVKT